MCRFPADACLAVGARAEMADLVTRRPCRPSTSADWQCPKDDWGILGSAFRESAGRYTLLNWDVVAAGHGPIGPKLRPRGAKAFPADTALPHGTCRPPAVDPSACRSCVAAVAGESPCCDPWGPSF